jgi:hypothetical protein
MPKWGGEKNFEQTIANKSLQEISNILGVLVNFATSSHLISKVHRSHIVTFINTLGHLLME